MHKLRRRAVFSLECKCMFRLFRWPLLGFRRNRLRSMLLRQILGLFGKRLHLMRRGHLPAVDGLLWLPGLFGGHLFDLVWLVSIGGLHQLRRRFVFHGFGCFRICDVFNLRGGNLFNFYRRVELFDLHKLRHCKVFCCGRNSVHCVFRGHLPVEHWVFRLFKLRSRSVFFFGR